jgi:hypothetical protein
MFATALCVSACFLLSEIRGIDASRLTLRFFAFAHLLQAIKGFFETQRNRGKFTSAVTSRYNVPVCILDHHDFFLFPEANSPLHREGLSSNVPLSLLPAALLQVTLQAATGGMVGENPVLSHQLFDLIAKGRMDEARAACMANPESAWRCTSLKNPLSSDMNGTVSSIGLHRLLNRGSCARLSRLPFFFPTGIENWCEWRTLCRLALKVCASDWTVLWRASLCRVTQFDFCCSQTATSDAERRFLFALGGQLIGENGIEHGLFSTEEESLWGVLHSLLHRSSYEVRFLI